MAGRTRDLPHKLGEVTALAGITLQQAPAVRQDALESASAAAEAVPKSLALALTYVGKGVSISMPNIAVALWHSRSRCRALKGPLL